MITLENLSSGYQKRLILENLNLSFKENRITGIIGPNGCGKTTLLKTAAGLLSPAKGKIMLDRKELSSYSRKELARKLSYLPQMREIPTISVAGLVTHGRFPYLGFPRILSARDQEIVEASMREMGIWEFRDRLLPELSGGERQKAYFAQLLAQDAQTVFLDEPTTYLDIRHQLDILALVKRIVEKQKTVVMILHDLVQAFSFCDYLLLMDKGRVLAYLPPEELYHSGKIEKIFQVSLEYLELYNKRWYSVLSTKKIETGEI